MEDSKTGVKVEQAPRVNGWTGLVMPLVSVMDTVNITAQWMVNVEADTTPVGERISSGKEVLIVEDVEKVFS